MGSAWESGGLITRAFLRDRPTSLPFGATSQIIILLAPLWLNGFIFIILGRVVLLFAPEQKVWGINARRLALSFVLLDITYVPFPFNLFTQPHAHILES